MSPPFLAKIQPQSGCSPPHLGIKLETSAPYTPQQNGTAERMNRTLKEHLKTLLAHVSAKQSLWREALQTAVLAYNLGPVVGRSVTPYQAFFGSKPSASALRSWGCKAFVLLPKTQTTATGPRSIPGMFVGYELHSKAYRIFTGTTVKVSRDVRFLEHVNGAAAVGFQDLLPLLPAISLFRLLAPPAVLDRLTLALLDFALDPVLVALALPLECPVLASCHNCNFFSFTNLQFHDWSPLELPHLPLTSLDLFHCRSLILTAAAGLSWIICRISPARARLPQWWTPVSKRVTLFFETHLPLILVAFTGWSAATA